MKIYISCERKIEKYYCNFLLFNSHASAYKNMLNINIMIITNRVNSNLTTIAIRDTTFSLVVFRVFYFRLSKMNELLH